MGEGGDNFLSLKRAFTKRGGSHGTYNFIWLIDNSHDELGRTVQPGVGKVDPFQIR